MSKAEEIISSSLRTILADLPIGAPIDDSGEFRKDVLNGLEFFLPVILREIHNEWKYESLDGIYPVVARKTGAGEVDIFGLCILISDQTLTPLHLRFQIASFEDEISWLECNLGEQGEQGMVRIPYDALNAAFKRVYGVWALEGNSDKIDWVYKVTFGERRL